MSERTISPTPPEMAEELTLFEICVAASERWGSQANDHRRAARDAAFARKQFEGKPWDSKAHLAIAKAYERRAGAALDWAMKANDEVASDYS